MPPRENAGLRLQTWFTEEYDNTPELRRREEELRPLKDFERSPDVVEKYAYDIYVRGPQVSRQQ